MKRLPPEIEFHILSYLHSDDLLRIGQKIPDLRHACYIHIGARGVYVEHYRIHILKPLPRLEIPKDMLVGISPYVKKAWLGDILESSLDPALSQLPALRKLTIELHQFDYTEPFFYVQRIPKHINVKVVAVVLVSMDLRLFTRWRENVKLRLKITPRDLNDSPRPLSELRNAWDCISWKGPPDSHTEQKDISIFAPFTTVYLNVQMARRWDLYRDAFVDKTVKPGFDIVSVSNNDKVTCFYPGCQEILFGSSDQVVLDSVASIDHHLPNLEKLSFMLRYDFVNKISPALEAILKGAPSGVQIDIIISKYNEDSEAVQAMLRHRKKARVRLWD